MGKEIFRDSGDAVESFGVVAGSDCCALNITEKVWYTLQLLERGPEILEVKYGGSVDREEDVRKM